MSCNIAILGAGSWGITLGKLLHEKGHKIRLWESDKKQTDVLKEKRGFKFLPEYTIPYDVLITSVLEEVLKDAKIIVFAVPSHVVAEVSEKIAALIENKDVIILIATKGIEQKSSLRMSEIVTSNISTALSNNIAVLSGPTIALEVSKKIPTAAVIASNNQDTAKYIQECFMTPYFRLYTSNDVIGVELGGAIKNIIAIAAGAGDGLGLGTNTKAALMTRGIVEITRLGVNIGARADTFRGLSGIGDLITTCISKYSRNRNFGEKIGQGKTIQEALDEIEMVVEGVKTAEGVYKLALKNKIEMPIIIEVYNILFKGKTPKEAVEHLMTRQAKPETTM